MKVFISWSGKRSNYVAKTLNEWIPHVIQNVEPWLSEEMPKGVRWSPEIAKALDETKFGVFCVTPENQGEPWLNFEAGALSKTVTERTYVCVYLIELRAIDVIGPLSEFHHTNTDEQDTKRLMKTMNEAQGDRALSDKAFEESFSVWWPHLDRKLKQLPRPEKAVPASRKPESIQNDILELVRKIDQRLNTRVTEPPELRELIDIVSLPPGSGKTHTALYYYEWLKAQNAKKQAEEMINKAEALTDKKKRRIRKKRKNNPALAVAPLRLPSEILFERWKVSSSPNSPSRIYRDFCKLVNRQPGELNLKTKIHFRALVGQFFIVPRRDEYFAKLQPIFRTWNEEIEKQSQKRSYVKRKRKSIYQRFVEALGAPLLESCSLDHFTR